MICDIIITIINKFIKYNKFISIRQDILAETLTHLLINEVIKNHEMSEIIISNRNKLFIFKF